MTMPPAGAYLIVNADDYGYFRSVSKGILRSASDGIVTATGMFANADHFDEQAAWLRDFDAIDVGVHLNLTEGLPLTSELAARLSRTSGRFPRKSPMAIAILSGSMPSWPIRCGRRSLATRSSRPWKLSTAAGRRIRSRGFSAWR